MAHLYGVALYFTTCYAQERFTGAVYSRSEFQYFWVYYVGFNAPWVVVPAGEWHAGHDARESRLLTITLSEGIIVYSIRNINRSTTAFDKVAATLDKKRDRLRAAFQ